MSLPTLTKTWQFDVNNAISATGSTEDNVDTLILAIKNAMIGFASSGWTVEKSSNGTTTASSDLWSTIADVVHSSGAHSWIVLKQTGMCSGNFQICWDFNSPTTYIGTFVVSANAGFTGGTTSGRPTATDEQIVVSSNALFGVSSDVSTRWSVMQTSDGTSTRILVAHSGAIKTTILIETPGNAVSNWTNPYAVLYLGYNTVTYGEIYTSYNWKSRIGSTSATGIILSEGTSAGPGAGDSTWGQIANELTNEWPMWPLGLAFSTAGVRGRHGSLTDLWTGSYSIAVGDTYPADGSNQFVQWSYLIFPWDGGSINLT